MNFHYSSEVEGLCGSFHDKAVVLEGWRFALAATAEEGAGRGKVASPPRGLVHGSRAAGAYQGPSAHVPGLLSCCVHLSNSELLPKGGTVTLHTDSKVQGMSMPLITAARNPRIPCWSLPRVDGITLGCLSPRFS